ncbi:MAG: 5-(carboxyamino)imidazole ribonucleotide synthase [Aquificaceae bacterium]
MRLGVLGGGQLGWMLALEAKRMGMSVFVLEEDTKAPACRVADRCFKKSELEIFKKTCDRITVEFEYLEEDILDYLEDKLFPDVSVLKLKKSRVMEKEFLSSRGYPVASFKKCKKHELLKALEGNLPAIIKTDSYGYDGRGQWKVKTIQDLKIESIPDVPLIVESLIDFEFEFSILGVRSQSGLKKTYPATINYHKDGILLYNHSIEEDFKEAKEIVLSLLEELNVVGLLSVEFFSKKTPIINELAPRPHNSAHFTLDGCFCSQFENLLRAIFDLPLGLSELKLPSGMVNIIGVVPDFRKILKLDWAKLYWYGKEPRPLRKLGHVNLVAKDYERLKDYINLTLGAIYESS